MLLRSSSLSFLRASSVQVVLLVAWIFLEIYLITGMIVSVDMVLLLRYVCRHGREIVGRVSLGWVWVSSDKIFSFCISRSEYSFIQLKFF